MPKMKLLFKSLLVSGVIIIMVPLTLILLYVSYVLAIGLAIILLVFIVYQIQKWSKKSS